MPEDNGSELMLAFKSGDESAFEEIMRRYKKPVLNIVYRFIGDSSEAEDIAQDVFVKVYKSKDKYYAGAKFSTWFYRIVSNLCISYLRRKKIMRIISLDAFWNDEDRYERPDEERLERTRIVREAIAKLPSKQRLAAIYRYYNDYSYEEIAENLNTSIQSVKSLLFRANQSLKKWCRT